MQITRKQMKKVLFSCKT